MKSRKGHRLSSYQGRLIGNDSFIRGYDFMLNFRIRELFKYTTKQRFGSLLDDLDFLSSEYFDDDY